MSNRLTKASRQVLLDALLAQRFEAERLSILAGFAKLADSIYELWASKYKIRPSALPRGWMAERSYFDVSLAGEVVRLRFDGEGRYYYTPDPVNRRLPVDTGVLLVLDRGDPHVAIHDTLTARRSDYDARRVEASNATHAALNRFTTVERLVEAWPECKPFVTIPGREPLAPLPVVQTERLNEMLGLGGAP